MLLEPLFNQLAVTWALIAHTWWLWVPPLLGYAGWRLWLYYLAVRYFTSVQWVLLEIRIPREIAKTPEAMEQVFAGLQTTFFDLDPWERYWLGLQHDYLVFEMASVGGDTRFYVRAPVFFRNVVEAQIYAQYPEAEVLEAVDYMTRLPEAIPNEEWNIFGVEFKLSRQDAYPIRTYRDITSLTPATEEFAKVDPFVTMAELMGKLRPGEHAGYHLLIRPAQTPKWKEEGEALIAKLVGRKLEAKKGKIEELLEPAKPLASGWGQPLWALLGIPPGEEVKAEEKKKDQFLFLSPDIENVVKAIARNISKPGWEVILRFCYVARRELFHLSHLSSFIGALKQYNTLDLNRFAFNSKSFATKVPWWLPSFLTASRKAYKMHTFWRYYRSRIPFDGVPALASKRIVLNTEELATIFHFPGRTAQAPMLPRIESKRSEAPATLPVG